MSSLAEQFSDALEEEGLSDATVHVTDVPTEAGVEIYVQRRIGDEKLTYSVNMSNVHTDMAAREKKIVMFARDVARRFEQRMADTYDFKSRHISLSIYDGGWAECLRCSTKVEVPTIGGVMTDGGLGECTTPSPMYRNKEQTISNMCDRSRMILRMYLIGLLRARCDHDCPNSKYSLDRKL